MIPITNYDAVAQMMLDMAHHQGLQCHNTSGDCYLNDSMCEAMNHCNAAEGHGKCSNQGVCECSGDWTAPDCSQPKHILDKNGTKRETTEIEADLKGIKWFYFSQERGTPYQGWNVKITTTGKVKYDVYIKQHKFGYPTEFDYDIIMKDRVGDVLLTKEIVGTDFFVAAVKSKGWDHLKDVALSEHFKVAYDDSDDLTYPLRWAIPVSIIGSVLVFFVFWWFVLRKRVSSA